MVDFSTARKNMVNSQVATADVTDRRILAAMLAVPREQFVPSSLRETAYMDRDIMIRPRTPEQEPRYLLAPMVFAKLTQLADIQPSDLVLDVGCATGYSTAVLARLADSVVGLEEDPELADQASQTLQDLSVDNAAIVQGALNKGYPDEAPYDVITLFGGVEELPQELLQQLKNDGRLVTVRLEGGYGFATIYRNIDGTLTEHGAFSAFAPLMPGFEREPGFVF